MVARLRASSFVSVAAVRATTARYAPSASPKAGSLLMKAVPRLRRTPGINSGSAASVCASSAAVSRTSSSRAKDAAGCCAGQLEEGRGGMGGMSAAAVPVAKLKRRAGRIDKPVILMLSAAKRKDLKTRESSHVEILRRLRGSGGRVREYVRATSTLQAHRCDSSHHCRIRMSAIGPPLLHCRHARHSDLDRHVAF